MSRQNRNTVRDRKNEEAKRDVADSNDRYSRQNKEESHNERERSDVNNLSGLDRHRMNDLYERSSM